MGWFLIPTIHCLSGTLDAYTFNLIFTLYLQVGIIEKLIILI
jgi:hypothetical protein